MGAVVQSVRQLVQRTDTTAAVPLDPKFEYLRVSRGRHTGLLWRGSTESRPEGTVEVYYSGSGEVVRLLNGRVVGALGLTTEWHHVSVAAPDFAAVAQARRSEPYVRVRDVMPGYRAGVRDELVLQVVPAPTRSALRGVEPAALTWFEEAMQTPRWRFFGDGSETLPPTRYAVDLAAGKPTVVYSEHCLAKDLCFSWQRWSRDLQQAQADSQSAAR
jgi:hypothetical protein